LVVHLTQNRLQAGFESFAQHVSDGATLTLGSALLSHAPATKMDVFWLAVLGLASGVTRETLRGLHRVEIRKMLPTVGLAVGVVLVLSVLCWPTGNISMGEGYAIRSIDPFAQSSD
jgi:hypothetical protein